MGTEEILETLLSFVALMGLASGVIIVFFLSTVLAITFKYNKVRGKHDKKD